MKVYVLECNQLAMKFLLGLLQRGVKATIAPLGADPENSPRKKNEDEQVVLVIDRGALNVPLQVSLRRLSRDFPQAKILVLDGVLSDDEICSLLNLGVDGFVAYNQVINLPRAISAVANGHVWAPLRILEHYVSYIHQLSLATRKSHDELSARETEVLQLLQEKLSNKEISASLEISESTVKFHLVRIFQKFGVHSRYELLATGKL